MRRYRFPGVFGCTDTGFAGTGGSSHEGGYRYRRVFANRDGGCSFCDGLVSGCSLLVLNIFVRFDNTIQHIDYRLLTKAIFEIKFCRLYIIFLY